MLMLLVMSKNVNFLYHQKLMIEKVLTLCWLFLILRMAFFNSYDNIKDLLGKGGVYFIFSFLFYYGFVC
jgi:hypothetical protein